VVRGCEGIVIALGLKIEFLFGKGSSTLTYAQPSVRDTFRIDSLVLLLSSSLADDAGWAHCATDNGHHGRARGCQVVNRVDVLSRTATSYVSQLACTEVCVAQCCKGGCNASSARCTGHPRVSCRSLGAAAAYLPFAVFNALLVGRRSFSKAVCVCSHWICARSTGDTSAKQALQQ